MHVSGPVMLRDLEQYFVFVKLKNNFPSVRSVMCWRYTDRTVVSGQKFFPNTSGKGKVNQIQLAQFKEY